MKKKTRIFNSEDMGVAGGGGGWEQVISLDPVFCFVSFFALFVIVTQRSRKGLQLLGVISTIILLNTL